MNIKTAIITGANGFLGSHLAKALSKRDVKVYAIVKDETRNIKNLEHLKNIEIIYCDLFNLKKLKEKIEKVEKKTKKENTKTIDIFYHFAWAGTSGDERGNETLQLMNVQASCDALKVAKEMNIKNFIFPGSVMEYECQGCIPKDGQHPGLGNIYSSAKLTAHYMTKTLAAKLEMNYKTLIISNIYGPGEISNRFINTTLLNLINRKETAFTEGNQPYDFIYIDDAISAMLLVGEKGKPFCNYYIGNKEQRPLKEYIKEMRDCIDKEIPLGFGKVPFNGEALTYKAFKTDTLEKEFNFKPEVTFKEGINQTIQWLKERT